MRVYIAASAKRLLEIAREVEESAARGGVVEVEIEAGDDDASWVVDRPNPVTLVFSNDEMEGRVDLPDGVVLVGVERGD